MTTEAFDMNKLDEEYWYNWFKSRGLRTDLEYQKKILLQKIPSAFQNYKKPIVLAACPSAGKTVMSIFSIEKYIRENPGAKVLVLTHGTEVLRSQYEEEIIKLQPDFTYKRINSGDIKNFSNKSISVYVTLPHTLSRMKVLPKFDLVVVDEAHHFYFAENGMVQKIIKKCKPKHQLLLTGTPSQFIYNEYPIIPVTVSELYDVNMVSGLMVEIVSSSYNFSVDDYNTDNNLKDSVKITSKQTSATLDLLLDEVSKRLTSAYRDNPEAWAQEKYVSKGLINKIVKAFKTLTWKESLQALQKTMIACKSQEQARQISKYFSEKGIGVALSTSDDDKDTLEIKRFKDDKNCLVLIVVARGVLGFNFPEMENVIDMTGSHNIDRIFQLLCRVLRKHPHDRKKMFFKVAPNSLEDYFKLVMTGVLALTNEYYYLKYNGKNFLNFKIPIIKNKKHETGNKESDPSLTSKDKRKQLISPIDFSGIDALELFKSIIHKNDGVFETYAVAEMKELKHLFFSHNQNMAAGYWSKERIKNVALKCKTKQEFRNQYISAYTAALKLGILNEVCNHMDAPYNNWNEEKVKNISLKCKSRSEFAKKYPNAYSWTLKHGLLNKLCEHMNHKNEVWNKEKIHKYALKCETRREFSQKYRNAYNSARRLKCLDEVCSHMNFSYKSWSANKISKVAKLCKTRFEFAKRFPGALQAAKRLNITSKIYKHMISPQQIWSEEQIRKVALKCKTPGEFQKRFQSAYNASRRLGIYKEVCSHMTENFTRWTDEKIHKLALKCKTKKEFEKKFRNAYSAARNHKILDKVCSHMTENFTRWTEEKIIKCALKCKTRREFKNKYNGAYNAARRLQILDKICSHMPLNKLAKQLKTLSLDHLLKSAQQHDTKESWKAADPEAYNAAKKVSDVWKECIKQMKN